MVVVDLLAALLEKAAERGGMSRTCRRVHHAFAAVGSAEL
jgi:hypothetical protein